MPGSRTPAESDEAAELVSDWADSALGALEDAQDSLDEEADSLEASIEQLTEAAGSNRTLGSGVQEARRRSTQLDPKLASALQESSTCQQLREETS